MQGFFNGANMQQLSDLYHYMGADINATSTGDAQTTSGTMRGQQRVLRRLLTNPGDYIFQPEYGAGLPKYIGQTANIPQITGLIRSQILLEPVVAHNPPPVISVKPIALPSGGGFAVSIQYTDNDTAEPVSLNFDVTQKST